MISGDETIYKMSNVYPSELRARMFSTNYLYYFTQNAYAVGATNNSDPLDPYGTDWKINDVWYQLEECSDPYAEDLVEALDIWDWKEYYSDFDRYMAVEQWDYDEETGTCEELDNLFHNDNNKGTYAEFFENDTRGLSMVKLKFKDEIMDNITDPVKFSGILNLYDVDDYSNPDTNRDDLLKSKKITAIVFPSVWNTTSERLVLSTGENQDANFISTNVRDIDVSVLGSANTSKDISMTYYSDAAIHDIQIDDWGELFLKPNAEDIQNFPNDLFFDERNYINYTDRVSISKPSYNYGPELRVDLDSYVFNSGYSDSMTFNVENLYSIKNHLGGNHFGIGLYKWFEMPLFFENVSVIDSVNIHFVGYGAGSAPDDINIDLLDYTGYYQEQISVNIKDFCFQEIEINIIYCDNVSTTLDWETFIGIPWLGMYHKDSIGQLDVEFSFPLVDNEIVELLPTFYTEQVSPMEIHHEFNITGTITANFLSSIKITAPKWYESELEVYSMSILNNSLNTTEMSIYYSYYFDDYQVQFQKMVSSIFSPRIISLPEWIVDNNDTSRGEYVDMHWTYETKYDFLGDANYDIAIQIFDGEGKGDEYDSEHGSTYFDNGVRDSILYDIGADGTWDLQEKWDNYVSVYNVSNIDTYDTGDSFYYVSRSQTVSYEIWADLTGDGMFNEMQSIYAVRSFQKDDLETGRMGAIPNYREFGSSLDYLGYIELENYFEEYTTNYDWSDWTHGLRRSCDMNADGIWEETVNLLDLFPNDDWVMDDMHENMIYETYDVHYIEQVPVYNATDPEQIIDYEYDDIYLKGNTLVTNASFKLLGADPLDYEALDNYAWLDDLDDNAEFVMDYQNITGEFVFVYDVPVVIDPRTGISYEQRVYEHGVQAWYDSDGDGNYEMCYEFTEKSWEENLAVAVYLSRSGLPIVYTDPNEYKLSGDTVVATHWLSNKYGFADIMDIAWDNAKESGWDKFKTADFWLMWLTDTAAGALMVAAVFALALNPLLGLVLFVGLFAAYQYWVRPFMQDVFEESCLAVGEKGHELNKPPDHGWNEQEAGNVGILYLGGFSSTVHYYLVHPFTDIFEDMRTWYLDTQISTYEMRVNFADATSFTIDQNPDEFDFPENPSFFGFKDDGLSEDALVWVNYNIPRFYNSLTNEVQEMEFLDLFSRIEHWMGWLNLDLSGWLNTIKGLEGMGLTAGTPNYVIMGGQWMRSREPAGIIKDETYDLAEETLINLLAAYHRHAMHQFYWRDSPTGEVDFWDESDPSDSWMTHNEIGRIESDLESYSKAGFDGVRFAVDDKGAPYLTASYGSFLNYSDPNVYALDYNMMCMISKYQTGYKAGLQWSKGLWTVNTILTAIQVGAGLLGGAAVAAKSAATAKAAAAKAASISKLTELAVKVLAQPALLKTASFLKNMISGIFTEMVVEEVVQTLLSLVNCPQWLSEALGEGIGDTAVGWGSKIFQIATGSNSFMILKAFNQDIKLYLNQQQQITLTDGLQSSTIQTLLNNPSIYQDAFKMLKAIQTEKITNKGQIKALTYMLNKDATIFKSGGAQNTASKYSQIIGITETTLHDYKNNQIPLEDLAVLLKGRIAEVCYTGTKDVLDVIYSLWAEAGLGWGSDGIWRSQHPEFFKKGVKYRMSIEVVDNKDGSKSLILYEIRGNIKEEFRDLTLEPKGIGLRDITTWLADGWQMRMVDPGFGIGTHPKSPLLKNYNSLGSEGSVTLSFNMPGGISWSATPDFYQKMAMANLDHLINPLNPANTVSWNLQNQANPYLNRLSRTARRATYVYTPNIGRDYPVSIAADSYWTNRDILQNIDPTGAPLSPQNIQADTIPYSLTLNPKFYQYLWSGEIKLADKFSSANFQFNPDLATNNAMENDYLTRLSQLNDMSIRAIRQLKGTLGKWYGQNVYALWDVVDWATTLIPAPGMRVPALTNYKGCAPSGYYSSISKLSRALDTNYDSSIADRFMKGFLTPLSHFVDTTKYSTALALFNNWRNVKTNLQFEALTNGLSPDEIWEFFEYPSDLGYVRSLSASLELIAYTNLKNFASKHISMATTWDRFYAQKLENAMNQIANVMAHTSNLDVFDGRSDLSKYRNDDLHLKFDQVHLANSLTWILTQPWRSTNLGIPLNLKIQNFIQRQAPTYYSNFAGWSASAPLFLSEYSGSKPYFGRFGEVDVMSLTMGSGVRDISWNRNNEYRFLNSLQNVNSNDDLPNGIVKIAINRIWGSESVGEHRLPININVAHGTTRPSQFIDFIIRAEGGEVVVYEIYGYDYRDRAYCLGKSQKSELWEINGHPIIHSPGHRVVAARVFSHNRPSFLMRTNPFFDNEQQSLKFNRIVWNIISESVRQNPANPDNWLHLHDVLFNMRKPANMLAWGIYDEFPNQKDAQEWVDKIQLIFGIHVNEDTFEFDYIINSPGLNIPTSYDYYNPAINAPAPNNAYNPQLDPFNSNFDPSLMPNDLYEPTNGNNYKYRWWLAYHNWLGVLSPSGHLSLTMSFLQANFP